MGKAIPYDKRIQIVERMKSGEKAEGIGLDMGYSKSGIKKIWYGYKKVGEEIYKNNYSNCGQGLKYGDLIRTDILEIRDNEQGGGYVRSKLLQKYPGEKNIPSMRTLQRWWVSSGTNRKKGRPLDLEKKVE